MTESEPESDPFEYVDVSDFKTTDAHPPDYVLEHILVENDDRPDELGVTPLEMENGSFTEWMVAEEGSFVALDDWR